MPPRDDELPEGTDHIINGAMETNGGGGAGAGGTGRGGSAAGGGGTSSGFVGAAGGDGTGGTAAAGGGGGGTEMAATEGTGGAAATTGGDSAGTGGGGGVSDQLRGQIYNLRDQAGGKVRDFAEGGKTRASDVLEELSRVVADTANSIDERLGNNYGEYARKAADSVSGLAESLRRQDVDELYDNVRSAVRKSPGVAIGIAAVVGFTLVRLVKAGLPADDDDESGGIGGGRRSNRGGTGA
jgi:hypothetical protein